MRAIIRGRSRWLVGGAVRGALTSVALSAVLCGTMAAGCSGTTAKLSGLATGCTVNSDCDSPLVCSFGACHAACKMSSDCAGGVCVSSNGIGVCRLDKESQCTYKSDCPAGLICAVDRSCRDQCRTAVDCLSGQVCATSGACADPADIDSKGELNNVADSGAGGASGNVADSGAGRASGAGGTSGAGGDSHTGNSSGGLPSSGGPDASTLGQGGATKMTGGAGGPSFGGGRSGAGGFPIDPGCGTSGTPCCGQSCTQTGTMCDNTNMCVPCGAATETCCAGDTCTDANTTCTGGSCVACGALSQPCCGAASTCNANLACTTSGVCDVQCAAPTVPMGGVCVAPAPRPVAPLSGSNLGTRSPKLSWALPSGITTAHVDVCKDRACTKVLFASDVTASSVVVGATLPPGLVFWRLHAADVLGTVFSGTWEMQIGGTHDAPRSTAWGAVPDFNGDGFADVVMEAGSGASVSTRVYSGGASGLSSTFATLGTGSGGGGGGFGGGFATFVVSDFDGDGFTDLLVPSPGSTTIYRGGSAGIATVPSQTFNLTKPGPMATLSAGDVNGDGYGDLIAPSEETDGDGNSFLVMNVYLGGPSGLSIVPQSFTSTVPAQQAFAATDTSDINGDGFADVTVNVMAQGGTASANAFYGGASGLSHTPTTIGLSGTGAAFLILSSAGDVNGDGYDDMLLGASNSVGLYPGSAAGLSGTATSTIALNANRFKGGVFQLGLGDANGDGYSDIVVPSTDPDVTVYLGSSGGLQTGAGVTLAPTPPASFVVSSAIVEELSASGDVNGDGFANLGLEVDWTSQAQLQSHQTYAFAGGAPISTAPAAVVPLTVSALR